MKNKKIISQLYNFLTDRFQNLQEITEEIGAGGKTRALSGETVEDMVAMIWHELTKEFPLLQLSITNGKKTPITISNHNQLGQYVSVKESVDKHCFINGELVMAIECKTYLDKPYMQRASSDFALMRRGVSSFKSVIVSLQAGLNLETYNFWMNEGYIDKVFFLSDVKRNSSKNKRIYYHLDWLNIQALSSLIDFMRETIYNYANNKQI